MSLTPPNLQFRPKSLLPSSSRRWDSRAGTRGRELLPSVSTGPVPGRQIQNALLLILTLYGSMVLIDPGSAAAALLGQLQMFVQFLAAGLFQ